MKKEEAFEEFIKQIHDPGKAITKEQIKKWQAVPPELRLEWLEEFNCFLYKAQSPQTRRIWRQFRRGEI